jgi:hypothetical protein
MGTISRQTRDAYFEVDDPTQGEVRFLMTRLEGSYNHDGQSPLQAGAAVCCAAPRQSREGYHVGRVSEGLAKAAKPFEDIEVCCMHTKGLRLG